METIIINEEPKGEVTRREQSKERMMVGWMDGMDFVRKVSTTMAKGKRSVSIILLRKRDGAVRYSTQEVKEGFLAQPVLLGCGLSHWPLGPSHLLLALALFLLRLHRRQDLQLLRDELGRIRSGGAGLGGINVGTERETPRVGRENVPHPDNAHDGFPTTDFFLSFPFCDV
jgi:hypothetical protein